MPKQIVYMLVEPADAMPIWFSRTIAGLRETCARRKLSVAQLQSFSELDDAQENAASMIVVSSQNSWTFHAVQELKKRNIMPVLLGAIPEQFGEGVSGIKLSRRTFIEKIMDYFVASGRKRIALVGVNHNASNDAVKAEVFLQNAEPLGLSCAEEDIYWIDSDISSSVHAMLDRAAKYDSAICSNDYVAVTLLAHAKEKGVAIPEDLYVAGLGDTIIGRYTSPTLTSTAEDEFFEMGRQAVSIWQIMSENPFLSNVIITVGTEIIARGSTAFFEPEAETLNPHASLEPAISIGPESQAVRNLENCLRSCDSLDLQILKGILSGKSNEQLEAELFLAHSSLYYRLRKLYQMANVMGRSELKRVFEFYLPNF